MLKHSTSGGHGRNTDVRDLDCHLTPPTHQDHTRPFSTGLRRVEIGPQEVEEHRVHLRPGANPQASWHAAAPLDGAGDACGAPRGEGQGHHGDARRAAPGLVNWPRLTGSKKIRLNLRRGVVFTAGGRMGRHIWASPTNAGGSGVLVGGYGIYVCYSCRKRV